jgi:hypothetical protein
MKFGLPFFSNSILMYVLLYFFQGDLLAFFTTSVTYLLSPFFSYVVGWLVL